LDNEAEIVVSNSTAILTVETVVMVVEVAVIALFTEVRVHNTVTTPTHLNTKSLGPHTESPDIFICVCKLM